MSKPLGVGIIGAGPVTQAIHLPTLASLGDRLQVVHIMDVNAEVGALVASRTGARSTTSVQTLLEDPEVDVVAICSPGQFHAAQVEAATAAGKLAILCEKPLATTVEEAQLIADVSAKTSARGRGCYVRLRSRCRSCPKIVGRPTGHRHPRVCRSVICRATTIW
jgi:myo-inositol 2-dehydrogenase / D-chiro-inositol 1-dehydrogenase